MTQAIIGVDVGGTLLRAACYDLDFKQLRRAEQPTLAEQGSEAVLRRLYETIRQIMPGSQDELVGIGLAVPGPIDPERGVLIAPPNLPFRDVPIVDLVQKAVGGRVYLGNDADLAGLAEYMHGAGQGTRSMVYMTISTGIGGGLILDGKLHTGRGQGGEVGHMVVEPDGPLCGCGRRGHLEAVASGTAIARTARERLEAGEPSSVRDRVDGDLTKVTAKIVGEAAQDADPMALDIICQAGRYIGIGIASLMMILNPDRFVLGGGVTRLGRLLLDPIQEAVYRYTLHPRYWENTPIVRATLGEDVGLVGAAALVQMRRQGNV